jgi:hypothetical protein
MKYRNKRTEVDGIKFDSVRESKRYGELKLLLRAKQIFDLRHHQTFALDVNGVPITLYEADFAYVDVRTGKQVVEDVKPKFSTVAARKKYEATAAYRMFAIKKRLMKACLKIEVIEV